jgi:hypothetical protein
MASEVEILLRFVLASVLGGFIGLETEIHRREAAVRTSYYNNFILDKCNIVALPLCHV